MRGDNSRLRRLESSGAVAPTRYLSSAARMVRVPVVTGVTAYVVTGTSGRNEVTVSWDDSVDPDVQEYEVWMERTGLAPTRVGTSDKSPADIALTVATTGSATLTVRTVMKNGSRLDLSLAPSTTVTLTS